MKSASIKLLVAVFVCLNSIAVFAQISPVQSANVGNPFIGTWDLNAADSDFGNLAAPQNMSRTYADLGDGGYMYMVVQINEDGSLGGSSASYRYDGNEYPIANLNQIDNAKISYQKLNERNVQYTVRIDDQVIQIGAKTISLDGRTLTIVIQFPDSDQGNQILRFKKR